MVANVPAGPARRDTGEALPTEQDALCRGSFVRDLRRAHSAQGQPGPGIGPVIDNASIRGYRRRRRTSGHSLHEAAALMQSRGRATADSKACDEFNFRGIRAGGASLDDLQSQPLLMGIELDRLGTLRAVPAREQVRFVSTSQTPYSVIASTTAHLAPARRACQRPQQRS